MLKSKVSYVVVSEEDDGQRVDNFLLNKLKGMPRTRVYRILRKGEVRVNKKRAAPSDRLHAGDSVRLPPVHLPEKGVPAAPSQTTEALLSSRIIYEDEFLLIINKPSGMSVHAGSTVRVGVIEALKHMYPKLPNLELAHRLDSETSGVLVMAKKKRILRELHTLLREGNVTKLYWALTKGKWKRSELHVNLPLHKDYRDGGKHVVEVNSAGKESQTIFKVIKEFDCASLVEARLLTGRTHQIRVHAASQQHHIAGDDRYGDTEFNKIARQRGLKRMFLHARSIDFTLPSTNQRITVEAPLDIELEQGLEGFEKHD